MYLSIFIITVKNGAILAVQEKVPIFKNVMSLRLIGQFYYHRYKKILSVKHLLYV